MMIMQKPETAVTLMKQPANTRIYTAFVKNNGLDFQDTYNLVLEEMQKAQAQKADLFFLPLGTFSGHGLGSLKNNPIVIDELTEISNRLLELSKDCNMVFVTDGFTQNSGEISPAIFVFFKGEILAKVPQREAAFGSSSEPNFPCSVCTTGNLHFAVANTSVYPLSQFTGMLTQHNCQFVLVSNYANYTLGRFHVLEDTLKVLSRETNTPIVYAEGYLGGSGVPFLHNAFGCTAIDGEILQVKKETLSDIAQSSLAAVSDLRLTLTGRAKPNVMQTMAQNQMQDFFVYAQREGAHEQFVENKPSYSFLDIANDPFKTHFESKNKNFLPELFAMQVKSLALRLLNTRFQKIVLPVSGGLDSTLALLVCIKALDILKLPRTNLLAVTMPGLGTVGTSYKNAVNLIKGAQAKFLEIDIKKATLSHFEDISHDKTVTDITFENAQARERTQIALDLANKHDAIFVGTGDLSEDALGWCTFGGDHLSNFNVNVCLTKTMVRQMVHFLSESEFVPLRDVLQAVLSAPVSPELVPAKTEETEQKTEEILGDYILHDFFLFYFIYYNLSFTEIYTYAKEAFDGTYETEQIKTSLLIFARRFLLSQFKRSCQPDATDLTGINLLGTSYHFSSDLQIDSFMGKLSDKLAAM